MHRVGPLRARRRDGQHAHGMRPSSEGWHASQADVRGIGTRSSTRCIGRHRWDLWQSVVAAAIAAEIVTAPFARARPTHGPADPLAAGVELETAPFFPLELGRTWTYRDALGNRYRHEIAGAASPLGADGKKQDWLRRREIYALPKEGGAPRLTERWLFEIDPERGIVSIGGEDPTSGTGPLVMPGGEIELPKKVTVGAWWIAYKVRYDFRGLADCDVAAGSYKGCLVIDAAGEHKLPSGERADTWSFYCRDVGRVAELVMVQGAWREGLEMEEATIRATGQHKVYSGPPKLPAGDSPLRPADPAAPPAAGIR